MKWLQRLMRRRGPRPAEAPRPPPNQGDVERWFISRMSAEYAETCFVRLDEAIAAGRIEPFADSWLDWDSFEGMTPDDWDRAFGPSRIGRVASEFHGEGIFDGEYSLCTWPHLVLRVTYADVTTLAFQFVLVGGHPIETVADVSPGCCTVDSVRRVADRVADAGGWGGEVDWLVEAGGARYLMGSKWDLVDHFERIPEDARRTPHSPDGWHLAVRRRKWGAGRE